MNLYFFFKQFPNGENIEISWKLHLPRGICLSTDENWIHGGEFVLLSHKTSIYSGVLYFHLIFVQSTTGKSTKMSFKTFPPWGMQFSCHGSPIPHGEYVFYLLKQLFPRENARKNSLKRDSLRKMLGSSNNKTKNSFERQEDLIIKKLFVWNAKNTSFQNLLIMFSQVLSVVQKTYTGKCYTNIILERES